MAIDSSGYCIAGFGRAEPARSRRVSNGLRHGHDVANRNGIQTFDYARDGVRDHIVQVKTVVLIALLAIARKFIILDLASAPMQIAALALALVALGSVYWLMRKRKCIEQCFGKALQESGHMLHGPGGARLRLFRMAGKELMISGRRS